MTRIIGRNIGKGATILVHQMELELQTYEELRAFHAPSECGVDAERELSRARRVMRRRIKAVTGLRYVIFLREVTRRTSYRWVYFNLAYVP
jgi:hypothetical protein